MLCIKLLATRVPCYRLIEYSWQKPGCRIERANVIFKVLLFDAPAPPRVSVGRTPADCFLVLISRSGQGQAEIESGTLAGL